MMQWLSSERRKPFNARKDRLEGDFLHVRVHRARLTGAAANHKRLACPCGVTLSFKKLSPGRASPLVTAAIGQSGSGVS